MKKLVRALLTGIPKRRIDFVAVRETPLIRLLRRISARTESEKLSDHELVACFVASRDPSSFAELVRRHGPLVFGVCRRVLGNEHDAEDAFQATFLVAAKKLRSIARQGSVGSWLYGVAFRLANKARVAAVRRRLHEKAAAAMRQVTMPDELMQLDLARGLDQEVQRLPEKYRTPIILCCFQGKAVDEAARELRCPRGTIGTRLARGRKLLRDRLTRRGITLSAGLMAGTWWPGTVTAVPPQLLALAIETMMTAAGAAKGTISPTILALAERELKAMALNKLKILASVLIIVSAGVGTSWVAYRDGSSEPPPVPSALQVSKATNTPSAASDQPNAKRDITADRTATIAGKVTFAGVPQALAKVQVPANNQDKDYCAKGDLSDSSLIVGADKGVENVVIWIRPPKGKYFDIPADQQKPTQMQVKVDQPFCAFTPHVTVLFPSFFDGREQKGTGQTFEIVNSATIAHNTNWNPSDARINEGGNMILRPNSSLPTVLNAAQRKKAGQEDLLTLRCNIHPWMTGYIWAFDHPYAAVTKADGSYQIKNVPAGADLRLVAWQEKLSYVLPEGNGNRQGMDIGVLKSGGTTMVNFKIGQ